MYRQTLLTATALALLAGCSHESTRLQNPVNLVTYRDAPLVRDVHDGMSREEVLRIGGTPSSTHARAYKAGSCNSYILSKDGREQPYYVTFDDQGKVDGSGFLTCSERDR
ncbi:osmotically-inducible lipoprotein OsmE, partial [Pseudomonas citronellolis]|uniref:osmotically-inducible lipoprotein OsmE n=1 Tax=Pseudomonas citronellolis TaxID=53408 RepID=UPI0023E42F30